MHHSSLVDRHGAGLSIRLVGCHGNDCVTLDTTGERQSFRVVTAAGGALFVGHTR